jgi:hypothetical protein
MNKSRFGNLVISAYKSHLKKRYLLICFILFVFIACTNIFNAARIKDSNVLDVLFLSFSGSSTQNSNLALAFQWLLIQIVVISMLGDFTFNQIFYKSTFILIRSKSKSKLWISQAIYISIALFVFFFLGFLVVYILSLIAFPTTSNNWFHTTTHFYNIPTNQSAVYIICEMFVLLYLATLCSVLFQSLISLITKNVLLPLVSIILLHIFSLNSGKININSVKWFIGNQSMLIRHNYFDQNVNNFSILWSLIYTVLMIIFIVIIGTYVINKIDIFIEQKN